MICSIHGIIFIDNSIDLLCVKMNQTKVSTQAQVDTMLVDNDNFQRLKNYASSVIIFKTFG